MTGHCALRRSGVALLVSFMLVSGSACARQQGATSVDATQAFPEPRVAELADAAGTGDAARVAALAKAGVPLDAHGDRNVTPLQWALLEKSTRGLEALVAAGADPSEPGIDGDTVVHLAAMADDAKYLDLLLANGADADARNGTTQATPLFAALRGAREPQFRALIKAGADVDAADRTGNRPLHYAAKTNQPGRVLDLLEAGADPRATTNNTGATFQRFLFKTRDAVLSAEARGDRERVRAWLRAHDIPIEDAGAQ